MIYYYAEYVHGLKLSNKSYYIYNKYKNILFNYNTIQYNITVLYAVL
jgi:hypothetical protein